MNSYTLIVPTLEKDLPKLINNLKWYFKYLPIDSICVIGENKIKKLLPSNPQITFFDEKKLIDSNKLKQIISERTHNDAKSINRVGWYIQQFVKMEYARYCSKNYYLIWDSDTIPLKPVSMFNNNKPIFDCKTEYNKDYFATINQILPGYKKIIKGSFISEHMIINTNLMINLLDDIEKNNNIKGSNFQEKILNAIPIDVLNKSGFSEFETFGTYVFTKYPGIYVQRKWRSMRFGAFFYNTNKTMEDHQIEWLSKYYDAISFEKSNKKSILYKLVSNKKFEFIFSPKILNKLALLIRIYHKILKILSSR